jgi:hypothetical protein
MLDWAPAEILDVKNVRKVNLMRVYWERIGVLGPIYRLVGQGFSDREIASQLKVTEIKVQECVSWMLHSFRMADRIELARDAFHVEHPFQPHKLKG